MIAAAEALQRLPTGNKRFVAGIRGNKVPHRQTIQKTKDAQNPFAIILGCYDSLVHAAIVLFQGMGDLIIIRVAGNIVASSQFGSIEFTVKKHGAHLVIILGHSSYVAVTVTLNDSQRPDIQSHSYVFSVVRRTRAAVESLLQVESWTHNKLLEAAFYAKILASTNQLTHESLFFESYIKQKN